MFECGDKLETVKEIPKVWTISNLLCTGVKKITWRSKKTYVLQEIYYLLL